MKIVRHAPITRGVTELMYVGDDDAVEKSTGLSMPMATKHAIQAGLFGVGTLLFFSEKKKRSALGLAALVGSVAIGHFVNET